jgi:phosphoribosylformylglycinamidine (FGAM) synthase-like amidotransferase family enzyme
LLAFGSISAYAIVDSNGRSNVSTMGQGGLFIKISGPSAKLLFNELTASHESSGGDISIRQSRTVVCFKMKKHYQCNINVSHVDGEIEEQPLQYVNGWADAVVR